MMRICFVCYYLVFWVFPYFMEGHILKKCPESGLKMSDYPIEYSNHAKFTGMYYSIHIQSRTQSSLNSFPLEVSMCNFC